MNPRVATARRKDDNPLVRGDRIIRRTFLALCESSNTPFANAAYHLYESGQIRELLALKFDPFFYEWNYRFADLELDYQIASFFKKYQDFDLGLDREGAAYDKWIKAETSCAKINQYFRDRWDGTLNKFLFPVEEVYYLAQRKITEILGTIGPGELDYIRAHTRHGPGADTRLKRRHASSYSKFQQQGEITPACAQLFEDLFNGDDPTAEADLAHSSQFALASKLSFVPKTALIDRAICVEPRWNVYLQLGIGDLIAKRLRRYGQDIHDQGRNQRAAARAYRDGLATVDLSSASDSVSLNLVVDMLACADPYWLELLLKSRTPYTLYKNKAIRLEKISSMGNGYTFPLETLIFYSFAYACCQFEKAGTRQIEVYGDDIIVPRKAYSLLVETLQTFGFAVNTDKSYASGSFFESCGKDFFQGREVRPFFLKKKVSTLFDAMVLHNQIVDWSQRNQVLPGLLNFDRWSIARNCVLKEIPRKSRILGPIGYSGVFASEFTEWAVDVRKTVAHRRRGMEGLFVRALIPEVRRRNVYGYYGHLYSKLKADLDSGQSVVIRDDQQVYRLGSILIPRIPDFVLDSKCGGMRTAIWQTK